MQGPEQQNTKNYMRHEFTRKAGTQDPMPAEPSNEAAISLVFISVH